MLARIGTVAFEGTSVLPIDVQVQLSSGVVMFNIVGLPDKAVAESRERVRGALHALGLALPAKRIIINLAPADVLKEGSHFDLPIALAVLAAMEVLPKEEITNFIALGELGLDAATAPVAGILPAAVAANAAGKGLICPEKTVVKPSGPVNSWMSLLHPPFFRLSIISRACRYWYARCHACKQCLTAPAPWIYATSRGKKPPNEP